MRTWLVLASLMLLYTGLSMAESPITKPKWEAGAGISAITLPAYRGSDDRVSYVIPFPYVVYRGERLKIDRQRIRELLFTSDQFDLDISVNVTPPVRSDRVSARAGMADLDPTLEFGPSLIWKVKPALPGELGIEVRLPVRYAIATDFSHVKRAGWVAQPTLAFDIREIGGSGGWNLGVLGGPIFGDRTQHNYFYGVSSGDARPDRPAYNAPGGYSGSQVSVALTRRFDKLWFGMFARADTLGGAAFADSPLMRTQSAYYAGFGIAWVFKESSERVYPDF